MTNDANVDVDRMKLRRVDIAKRVVALRLILLYSIIILQVVFVLFYVLLLGCSRVGKSGRSV